jgi:threonylcarbamoyladenosine tRNA methylthiotransferase MtaB
VPIFSIITLGCKVNQYESEAIARRLGCAGGGGAPWVPAGRGETSDVCVVNTCTVTARAAMQSRQAIRRAVRSHPGAKIIVTGCYAQTAPGEIERIEGVDRVIGHSQKDAIPELLLSGAAKSGDPEVKRPACADIETTRQTAGAAGYGASRTRPFVKIQDGCNAFCTYCIVPHARGRSRSRPPEAVLTEVAGLGRCGYREVVLTGIHLGCYGLDLSPPTSLLALVDRLRSLRAVDRIRLSSIEPAELSDGMIAAAAESAADGDRPGGSPGGLLCPHFHVPLQSGDDRILAAMGRPYSAEFFADRVATIHRRIPHAAVGVDVLVGFPGEDGEAFENTYRLVERLPVAYLHVFPFSARKGTPAYTYPQRVPVETVRRRCERMRRLGSLKKEAFYRRFIGRPVEVLVESRRDRRTGLLKGITPNYLSVFISGGNHLKNRLVEARVDGLVEDAKGSIHGICKI